MSASDKNSNIKILILRNEFSKTFENSFKMTLSLKIIHIYDQTKDKKIKVKDSILDLYELFKNFLNYQNCAKFFKGQIKQTLSDSRKKT